MKLNKKSRVLARNEARYISNNINNKSSMECEIYDCPFFVFNLFEIGVMKPNNYD